MMTDAMVQSQQDCLVVRICKDKSVHVVSAGHRIVNFQAKFVMHRNAVNTAKNRTLKIMIFGGRNKEEMLKEIWREM